ncbi:MAG: hypothetical protein QXL19_07645 [Ignisphaera sp.]
MKLSEFLERYPEYRPYVDVLIDYLMAPPEEIEIGTPEDLEKLGYTVSDRVVGLALPPNKLFFREIPPSLYVFVHELIHLCNKPPIVHEEIYASNLVELVVFCAEKRMKCNPFALFELSVEDIENVLKKYGIQTIEEYYMIIGIVPVNYELVLDEAGKISIKPNTMLMNHPERDRIIVELFVSELIAGIPYYTENSIELQVLLDLIERTRGSGARE